MRLSTPGFKEGHCVLLPTSERCCFCSNGSFLFLPKTVTFWVIFAQLEFFYLDSSIAQKKSKCKVLLGIIYVYPVVKFCQRTGRCSISLTLPGLRVQIWGNLLLDLCYLDPDALLPKTRLFLYTRIKHSNKIDSNTSCRDQMQFIQSKIESYKLLHQWVRNWTTKQNVLTHLLTDAFSPNS